MRSNLFFKDTESIQKILPIYFQSWWLDLAYGEKNWSYIIVKNSDGFIIGLLPISIKKKWGIKIITTTKDTHYSGPFIIYDKQRKPDSHLSYEHEVIEKLLNQIPNVSFIYFQLYSNLSSILPFYWKKYKLSFSYTYKVNLNNTIDNLIEKVKGSTRTEIKKCKQNGVKIKFDIDTELFFEFVQSQKANMSFEYDVDFYKKLLNSKQKGKLFDLICAVNENEEILAGIIVIYDCETVFYKLGISKKNRIDNGALTFCLWESICHYKEQGLNTFDFEGSDIKTIEHFFRSFGGDLTPVYRVFWSKNLFVRILAYLQNSKIFG